MRGVNERRSNLPSAGVIGIVASRGESSGVFKD